MSDIIKSVNEDMQALRDCDPQEFNDGHIIEGLDRCHTIMEMIDLLLIDHPAVVKAKVHKKLRKAQAKIMDAYQAIGDLEDSDDRS